MKHACFAIVLLVNLAAVSQIFAGTIQPPVFATGVFAQKEKLEIGRSASFQIVTEVSGGAPASYIASGLCCWVGC